MNAENPTDIRRTPTQPHTDSDPVVQRGPVELLLGNPRLPVLAHRRRRVSTQVNFIDAERISISDLTPGHTSAYIISKKKIRLILIQNATSFMESSALSLHSGFVRNAHTRRNMDRIYCPASRYHLEAGR